MYLKKKKKKKLVSARRRILENNLKNFQSLIPFGFPLKFM